MFLYRRFINSRSVVKFNLDLINQRIGIEKIFIKLSADHLNTKNIKLLITNYEFPNDILIISLARKIITNERWILRFY